MTISSIAHEYPDATPDLLDRLADLIRRELEADAKARRSEIAAQAARAAQARRLDAMMAGAVEEAAPEPSEGPVEPPPGKPKAKPKHKPDPAQSAARKKGWVNRYQNAVIQADGAIRLYLNRPGRKIHPAWSKVEGAIRKAIDPAVKESEGDSTRRIAIKLISQKLPADIPDEIVEWAKWSKKWLEARGL